MFDQIRIALLLFLLSTSIFAQSSSNSTITICWDASFSMQERQITKDLSFLDSLITKMNVDHVQLLSFSNEVTEQNFQITNGDWSDLRETLANTAYDGGTNFQALNKVTKKGKSVVFTDGNKIFKNHLLSLDEGDILVNSSTKGDHKTLKLWEYINRANLIDLTNGIVSENDDSIGLLISGSVYMDGKPLNRALIYSSTGKSIISDADGRFQYRGNIGDTLLIKFGQNLRKELIVENAEGELNFFLDSRTVELEEVTVTEERLKELDLVDVGYANLERKKVGFAVYDIPEERISEVEGTVTEVLQEVPGLLMSSNNPWDPRNSGLSTARMRGKSSISFDPKVLVVVDGTPLQRSRNNIGEQNASYFHINPQNIKSIQVLKGLAATNLYGSEGSGGVIMIKTKTASVNGATSSKPVDQALLTNNIFEGKLVSKKTQLNTPYLKELKKSKNLAEAYKVYLGQRDNYLHEYQYFIDVSEYFRTANSALADKVLSNLLELPFGYEEQRTLFLYYSKMGNTQKAVELAEYMVENYPIKIQSYLDLATSNRNAGNFRSAAEVLNGIITGNINPGISFVALNKIAGAELRNLANTNRTFLDLSKIDNAYKNNITYNARLRFDWASPQSEFILKFVNPQGRYFNWEHSNVSDKTRIVDEIKNGYGTEQFELIGDISRGKWGIYITNLSVDKSKGPYWVKCTIDYNFGKPNQRSEEKLVRLDPSEDDELLFFEFIVN